MRRADRLFQIIQILRGAASPMTADRLAQDLEVSVRTVYRDIADLMAQRVPIRGEAGVGYVMESGYDMPPLMLTAEEVDAAVLGATWVASRGDPALARGAKTLITKIADVIPDDLRPIVLESNILTPVVSPGDADNLDLQRLRTWIRRRGKLRILYEDLRNKVSDRIVWPIALAYFETARLLIAWCELRNDFRHFRTDRVLEADFLEDTYPRRTRELRDEWWRQQQEHSKSREPERLGRED